MVKAIQIEAFGGSDEMKLIDIELAAPGPGEVRLEHKAISVHFADIMIRQGIYFLKPDLPAIMGLEAVGEITATGPDVTGFKPGDRAGYTFSLGSYTQARNIPANGLIAIPDGVGDVDAAAGLLRGMTAQYLLRQTYPVKAGDTVLLQAAAGGMGSIMTQWCKHLGAVVIGTAGTDAKVETARANGCDHVINYAREDFAAKVDEITGGKGVDVVYDSVGKDTYDGNLKALSVLGNFVNFGHSSGFLPPIDAMALNAKSLKFTKTSLRDYAAQPGGIATMSGEAFKLIADGVIKLDPQTYPLAEAARAQDDMTARKTTGQVILTP